jgi:hypothetical protein
VVAAGWLAPQPARTIESEKVPAMSVAVSLLDFMNPPFAVQLGSAKMRYQGPIIPKPAWANANKYMHTSSIDRAQCFS